jgi:Sulfotransferase family
MIGIGAQKAGTSWLYHALRAHPDCHLRSIKELNYWNRMAHGGAASYREWMGLQRRVITAETSDAWQQERLADLAGLSRLYSWPRSLFYRRDRAYRAYLSEGRGRRRLVGEITPEYSRSSRETFARMAEVGGDVRFVFILRDPVERLWSAVRMNADRRGVAAASRQKFCHKVLDQVLGGANERFAGLSDYRATLENFLASVPRERLFVGFFEELFTEQGLRQVTDFLGIAPGNGHLRPPMHVSAPLGLKRWQRQRLAQHFRGQYEAIRADVGRLPPLWEDQLRMVA